MKSSRFRPRHPQRASSLALVLAAAPGLVLAQSDPAAAPQLAETVVTANRTPTPVDELMSDVTVINRAQIERQANRTLPELLARVAGVQITANGGPGKTSNVFIRGAESRHTVLLVDGVRYGSATTGTPAWENIPLEMIERIEVVKGPASALYGSDGVGGVVQIFTRKGKPGETSFNPYASVTIGSERYRQAGAGFSGASGDFTYALSFQHTRERGFSATNPKVSNNNYNPDVDPFRQDALNLSLGWQLGRDWKLETGALYSDGLSWLDDGPRRNSVSAIRTETGYLGVRGKVMDKWSTQLRYSRGMDRSNALLAAPTNLPGLFKTTQDQYLWQNDIETPIGVVIAGLERREQKVDSSTAYTVRERTIDSAFLGLNGSHGEHSWQLNLRRDRNSQFGNANTWFAGYGWQFAPHWRFNVSTGTSFVAPSFNQLYFPSFGNPALQPERGRNTDIGITWSQDGHTVKFVRFDNKIRGFITNTTRPENIARTRIEGFTLSYDGQFGNWGVHASYDNLDPANEQTGKQLPRRAEEQLSLGVDYTRGPWKLGGSWLRVGERFDDVANTPRFKLPGYATMDVYAEYQFAKDWSLQARIANLTNKQYETAYGYNQRGRAGYLTVKWQPR